MVLILYSVCLKEIGKQGETFDGSGYRVSITGLVGGHSGVEIDKGRANANVLMGRFLATLAEKTEMRLASVNGGSQRKLPRLAISTEFSAA